MIYPPPEILLLVLCATLSGMEDFVEIKLWVEQRIDFLRRFLAYDHGVPSHDTLNDVMNALDPELFKACFTTWVDGLRESEPDIIAIDGKTFRRSHARTEGCEPLDPVSAWACQQRLVLGQEAVGDKSNEIVAIPLLLERLAPRTQKLGRRQAHGHEPPAKAKRQHSLKVRRKPANLSANYLKSLLQQTIALT